MTIILRAERLMNLMNKRITQFLITILVLILGCMTVAAGNDTFEKPIAVTNFTGGLPAGILLTPNLAGAVAVSSYIFPDDAAYGQCVRIGYASALPPSGSKPFIRFVTGGISTAYSLEAEVYFTSEAITTRNEMVSDNTGGCFIFNNGNLELTDGEDIVSHPFEAKTWYRFKIVLDTKRGLYDFYFAKSTDELVKVAEDYATPKEFTNTTQIRIFLTATPEEGGYMLLDNAAFYGVFDKPYVEGISYDGNSMQALVPFDAHSVDAYLSTAVDNVTINDVQLLNAEGNVELTEVFYDGASRVVRLFPRYNLTSNTNYTLWISNATIDQMEVSQTPIVHEFTTAKNNLEIENYEFHSIYGEVQFQAHLSNQSGEEKRVYAIVTVWEGERLMAARVTQQLIAPNGQAKLSTIGIGMAKGQAMHVSLVEDLQNPFRIGKAIYSYTAN